MGPTKSFETECRGVPVYSPENWLCIRFNGTPNTFLPCSQNWDLVISPEHNRSTPLGFSVMADFGQTDFGQNLGGGKPTLANFSVLLVLTDLGQTDFGQF